MTTRRGRLLAFIGLAISAVFLFIAFRDLKPEAILAHIREANGLLLLLAAAWYFTAVTIISKRWSYLLRAIKPIPVRRLIPLTCIGYMGNNVYPLRAGEILRLALLQKREGIAFTRGAVVTVAERVFDGLVMLTFVIVGLALLRNTDPQLRTIAAATAPLFIIALAAFFIIAANHTLMRRIINAVAARLPGKLGALVAHFGDEVLAGMAGLRSPADMLGTVITSYLSWMFEASVYWLVMLAFNLNLDYSAALLLVGVVNLAGLIPASPGQFGVYETFAILVLASVGIERQTAQAYALVMHLVIWLPVTVIGFLLLVQQGLGWGAVARARAALPLDEKKAAVI